MTEFPHLSVRAVAANSYPIGDDSRRLSRPAHHIDLEQFYVMQYAVSNALYTRFVQASGYQQDAYWSTMGRRWLKSKGLDDMLPYLHEPQFGQLDQPVVGVSWYEAQAFANWLRDVTGQAWRLPTEAEWEAAARGTAEGEDISGAHTANSTPHRTIPVTQIGHQAWCGAVNMCGNVWEWCSTRWGRNWQSWDYRYPYVSDDGREDPDGSHARVMRGGSWFDPPQQAQPAARARYLPGSRGSNIGFRLVYS